MTKNMQATRTVLSVPAQYTDVVLGARAAASSSAEGYRFKEQIDQHLTLSFSPEGAINGDRTPRNWGRGNGWMDGDNHGFPKWFQVTFPEATTIDTVIVHTFPEHVAGHNRRGLRDYQVQCLVEGTWQTVGAAAGNVKGVVVHRFAAVRAARVRLWITAVNLEAADDFLVDDQEYARLLEIEAYHLGDRPLYKTESWTVTIEREEQGSVAIFRDVVPRSPGASDPQTLGKAFREAGYGVTFLDGRSLRIPEIFNARNFDIFVHPYGPFFPIGTCLYDFLRQGGHLITLGGYAFSNALMEIEGTWQPTGYDPGINATVFRLSDCPYNWRDQLGIFTTAEFTLDGASRIEGAKDVPGLDATVAVTGSFGGRGAAGMVGEFLSFEEEEQLTKEGRWPEYVHAARAGVRGLPPRPFTGCLQPELTESYSWIVSRARSRWRPLLQTRNELGQIVAPAAGLMENHYGPYRGSCWAFCGVDNTDLFCEAHPTMLSWLVGVAAYFRKDCLLHSAMPELASCFPDERACVKAWVENFRDTPRRFEVEAVCTSRDTGESQTLVQAVEIEAKGWKEVRFEHPGVSTADSFIDVALTLREGGETIDRDETGFVVWNREVIAKGRKIEYRDNYLHENGRPIFLSGCRFSEFNVHGQPMHSPLDRDRDFRMMKDNGLEIASNVFFDYYVPGFSWGEELDEVVPTPLLRQLDASVQLAQQYGIIYAPTPFFVNERPAKEKVALSRKLCRLLGERYKNVPGIYFYLWDDGLRMDPDKFNGWVKECIEALNSSGRKYIVTAEFTCRTDGSDVVRACAKHLDFLAVSCYQAVGDPVANKLLDMRSTGRNLSAAEFTSPIDWYADRAIRRHGHFAEPHNMFGMGHCLALNYEWLDETKAGARFGLVSGHDRRPKHLFWVLRNQALFFRRFTPRYQPKPVAVVLPMARWLSRENLAAGAVGGQMAWVWSQFFPAKVIRRISQHLRAILDCGVDYDVIDDTDLDRLSPAVRTLIYPLCYGLDEDAYTRLKAFVEGGGTLYLGGDPTFDADSSDRDHIGRLRELFGAEYINPCVPDKQDLRGPVLQDLPGLTVAVQNEAGERIGSFTDFAALVVRAVGGTAVGRCVAVGTDAIVVSRPGKGRVWYTPSVSDNLPLWLWREFFHFAGVTLPVVRPEDKLINLFQQPEGDGEMSMVFYQPWPSRLKEFFWHAREHSPFSDVPEQITFASRGRPVTLAPSRCGYGVCSLTREGELWALETQGKMTVAGEAKWGGTAHVMAFTLDGRDIGQTKGVVVLPFSEGRVEVFAKGHLNRLTCGEIVGGRWRRYTDVDFRVDASGTVSFDITGPLLRTILVLCDERESEICSGLV